MGGGSLATSVIARYWIGAAACSKSHVNGNETAGDEGVITGVIPGVVAPVFERGGRVTMALV
jgi:hypothetical protein